MSLLDAALEAIDGKQRRTGPNGAKVCCVAHDDSEPSLSLNERDGMLLYRCHAGCDQRDVGDALHLLGIVTGRSGPAPALSPQPGRGWTDQQWDDWYYGSIARLHTSDRALSWLAERGISQDEAEQYGLGYGIRDCGQPFSGLADRIVITVGRRAAEGRRLDGDGPKWKTMAGTVKWGWWADGGGACHVMVEGAWDAMAVARFGSVGIAVRGVGGLSVRDQELLRQRKVDRIFVCPDHDKRNDPKVIDRWMASAASVARPWIVTGDRWGDLGDYLTLDEDAFFACMSEAMTTEVHA